MKRSQKYRNRRGNIFNHLNRNVVYPSLYLDTEDINKQPSVEITELKSDEESEKGRPDNSNYSHVWCSESEEQENKYKINREARERRRERRAQYDNDELYNDLFDQMCTEFYGIDCHGKFDRISGNPDKQCFTIINNNMPYDTSSDEDCDLELQNHFYKNDELINKNDEYLSKDYVAHDNGFTEKRTIFIFSEKNKRALSEQDYEMMNITNKDSSSTITDDEEPTRDIGAGNIRRLATPIPAYMPKLFLPISPTLPTVTEVMESHNKSSSNVSEVNENSTGTAQLPRNNWIQDKESVQNETERQFKENKSISWSSLTPREKRRIKNEIVKEESFAIQKTAQEPIVIIKRSSRDSANVDIIEKEMDASQLNELVADDGIQNDTDMKHSSEDVSCNLHKPQIKLNSRIKPHSEITEPLEKPDGKWIGDETDVASDVYDYDLDQKDPNIPDVDPESNKTAGGRLFVTNMSLLKPAAWTQYLPIAGSVPSLHLSFQTVYEDENKSCLNRLLKYLNCCRKV